MNSSFSNLSSFLKMTNLLSNVANVDTCLSPTSERQFGQTSARSELATTASLPSMYQKQSTTVLATEDTLALPIPFPSSLHHKKYTNTSLGLDTSTPSPLSSPLFTESVVYVPKRKQSPDIVDDLISELNTTTPEQPTFNIDDLLASSKDRPQTDSHNVSLEASTRPTQRRRMCLPALAKRVYITTPTIANETMKTFAKRTSYSVHILRTYNPMCNPNKALPIGTCFLTWEHSNTLSSCFEVVSENYAQMQHSMQLSQLLCNHVGAVHQNIQCDCRIANDTEFVPEYAQHMFDSLSTHQQLKLTKARTFKELLNQDKEMGIDWDKIAKNPQRVPAIYKNTQERKFEFFFEKHLRNGNVKGAQKSVDTVMKKKKSNYTCSFGVEKEKVHFRKNTLVPTHVRAKKQSIASCEELVVVDKTVATMYSLDAICDSRKLYTDVLLDPTTSSNGCIYTQDAGTQTVRDVGVWTTCGGLMCYTMYGMLPRIVVKTV